MFRSLGNSFQGTRDFINSNSLVAKVAFLLLILIVFILLLRFGVSIMSYFFTPAGSPHIIKGMVDATQMRVIPQDPSVKGSIPILRSNNQDDGIEFTWSVFVYIKNLQPENKHKHIFHKGNDAVDYGSGDNTTVGLNFPNNSPGLYITPNTNNLAIVMNTFDNINEEVEIEDIPLNKWINVIIRVVNHNLDVYINGTIVRRHKLKGVPKQNYGNVYVSMNGGYNGFTSSLRYWNYALGIADIQRIVSKGPNMKMDDVRMDQSKPKYFSLRWFFNNDNIDADRMGYGGL